MIAKQSTAPDPSYVISIRLAVLAHALESNNINSSSTAAFISTSITDPQPLPSIFMSNNAHDPVLVSTIDTISVLPAPSLIISIRLAVLAQAQQSRYNASAFTAAFISILITQPSVPIPSMITLKIDPVPVLVEVTLITPVLPAPSCLTSINSASLAHAQASISIAEALNAPSISIYITPSSAPSPLANKFSNDPDPVAEAVTLIALLLPSPSCFISIKSAVLVPPQPST